jgi:hypothetical protein
LGSAEVDLVVRRVSLGSAEVDLVARRVSLGSAEPRSDPREAVSGSAELFRGWAHKSKEYLGSEEQIAEVERTLPALLSKLKAEGVALDKITRRP